MIIFFHVIYGLIKQSCKKYFNKDLDPQLQEVQVPTDIEESLVFVPPVYRQRYLAVKELLQDNDIKKVVDFGCAELSFFVFLKNTIGINHILEVDIDTSLLDENIFKVEPLTTDYLSRRAEPLIVEILSGSMGDPDYRLSDVDAVIGIEVIEHVYPDTLEALSYNIFGYIKPKLAIFTTPNSDFNVLFPNFTGFRHYDHKFEWTREQFEDWAKNQILRFPDYSVQFEGIGKGPKSRKELGCCSQMAIFTRLHIIEPCEPIKSFGICTYHSYSKQFEKIVKEIDNKPNEYYELVEKIAYPFNEDTRSAHQKLLDELIYFVNENASIYSEFYNDISNCVEIPLDDLDVRFENCYKTVEELKTILVKTNYIIENCTLQFYDDKILCAVYDFNIENSESDDKFDENDDLDRCSSLNSSTESELNWDRDQES